MQTFLPFRDFAKSAQVLDTRRLGKQIVECQQLYQALTVGSRWSSHPCARLWRGYEEALVHYGLSCYDEWRWRWLMGMRGGKLLHKSGEYLLKFRFSSVKPPWITEQFCANHRAILLGKDYEWYKRFGWPEQPAVKIGGR